VPRRAFAKTGYIAPLIIGTTPAIIAERAPGIVASNLAGLTVTRRAQVRAMVHPAAGPWIPPSTGPQNTIYDIYMDYLTAPGGSWGIAGAALLTTVYVGLQLWGAYQVGYGIGSGIAWFLSSYCPGTWAAIGDGIGAVMDHLEAGSGLEEYILSQEFGVPLAEIMTPTGDIGAWGTMDLSASYWGGNDGGGGLCLNGC
jgi:hypothetical protein